MCGGVAETDRETEALSVTGSVDVDDLESGLDTPVKVSTRPAFLDSEALSSQTDEWVRVSDFDVGTPTSQTEENDRSTEDGDIGNCRRSVDKLAEWETVPGDHFPGRQEGSIHSLEEEPSECDAVSAHSSESYANLPSPHLAEREKDSDSRDSERKNRLTNRSACSCSSSSSTEEKSAPTSAEIRVLSGSVDMREEVSSLLHLPSVPAGGDGGPVEEIRRLNVDSVKEKRERGAAPMSEEIKLKVDGMTRPTEGTIIRASDIDDTCIIVGTLGIRGPVLMETNPARNEVLTGSTELAAVNSDEEEETSLSGKDFSEVGPILSNPIPIGTSDREREVLSIADGMLTQGSVSGEGKLSTSSLEESSGKEDAVGVSLVDVGNKEVNTNEKIGSPTIHENAATADNEVASSSADAGKETTKGDAPDSEVANFTGKKSFYPQEFTADSFFGKSVLTSGISEPTVLGEVGRHSLSTPVEKNVVSSLARSR